MNKTQLLGASLIVAIPGAALAVILVMAFLSHAGGSSMLLKVLAGVTLVASLVLATLPVTIFVVHGPKKPKPEKPSKKKAADDEEGDGLVATQPMSLADSNAEEMIEAEAADTETGEFAALEDYEEPAGSGEIVADGESSSGAQTGELVMDDVSAEDVEFIESGEVEVDEDFDFDFDEEEPPKKGKK